MAVYCQNLTLGALSGRSALSVLVGTLFKKFGLFLNTPRIIAVVESDTTITLLHTQFYPGGETTGSSRMLTNFYKIT